MTNSIGHDPEDEIEASRAPLLEHLTELRSRLIICVVALFIGFGVCFFFADQIFLFLVKPFTVGQQLLAAQHSGGKHGPFDLLLALVGLKDIPVGQGKALDLVYTAALEFFFTKIKLAGFGAVVVTFPVLAWQLYRFVAPGLYKNERGAFLPFLLASPFMFILGAALVYYVMLPFVLWFSMSQQISTTAINIQLLPKVSDYLTLVTSLLLAFGLCFQLPVVVSLLGMAGIIDSKMLRAGRRYAIVGVFIAAAILTPPDPISQLTLAIPMCLLYEIGIWCVWIIERGRKKREAEESKDVVAV
ncbi:twin-arginine translocase subunit TatC [Caulobacter flavus]|uniref:Sec-independent protein translocase protein TatC n=1 Tax=Caulobacter flavus TaxID=1679497 RepID=A0A2N5D368_9CAUL|nr:twin-arginine translocase subunit TatC [Caulobacter flavus]AYV48937.1 twin-arginine translocase subunit TatC [Caulobacter flavus]PLR20505.1 twin-arginine translocase subunit TatC [Caulobacter flavus]